MINPEFYNQTNVASVFLDGKRRHYLHKPKTITLAASVREMQQGEDLYDVAADIFGSEQEYFWTIIGDANRLRMPDDWGANDVIWQPSTILRDSIRYRKDYSNAKSTTTEL